MKRTGAFATIGAAVVVASWLAIQANRIARTLGEPMGRDVVAAVRHRLGHSPAARELPTLVLLSDPECAACARASADFERLDFDYLGVEWMVLTRGDPSATAVFVALGERPIPTYLLLDADETLLATQSGYVPIPVLLEWIDRSWSRPTSSSNSP